MATQQNFRLDSQAIIQLLGDPDFFDSNVAFLFMRDSALVATEKYQLAVLNKEEGCCDNNLDESVYVSGSIGTFVATIMRLRGYSNPEPLQAVRKYIEQKLGYQPQAITMYYNKVQGKVEMFEF